MVLMSNSSIHHPDKNIIPEAKLEDVFNSFQRKMGPLMSEKFLQRVFGIETNKKSDVSRVTKHDLIDLIILFVYLNTGKRLAAMLIKSLASDLDLLFKKGLQQLRFARVCSIMFCKAHMFSVFANGAKKLGNKLKRLLDQFMALTTELDSEQYSTDELFQTRLLEIINNQELVSVEMRQIFEFTMEDKDAKLVGKFLFERIRTWANPTPQMIKTLKGMLMIEDQEIFATRKETIDEFTTKVDRMVFAEDADDIRFDHFNEIIKLMQPEEEIDI